MRGGWQMAGWALISSCVAAISVSATGLFPNAGYYDVLFPLAAVIGASYGAGLFVPFAPHLPNRRARLCALIAVSAAAYLAANITQRCVPWDWPSVFSMGFAGSLVIATFFGRILQLHNRRVFGAAYVVVGTVAAPLALIIVAVGWDPARDGPLESVLRAVALFATWQCATAAVLGPALDAKRTAAARTSPPTCDGCAYDLTGNVSGRCPECGREIPPATQQRIATTQGTERRPT